MITLTTFGGDPIKDAPKFAVLNIIKLTIINKRKNNERNTERRKEEIQKSIA
jgi:hypothetical protein